MNGAPASALPYLIETLAAHVLTPASDIDPDQSLSALPKTDPVAVMEAFAEVEQRFRVLLPGDFFRYETATLRDLAAFVDRLAAGI